MPRLVALSAALLLGAAPLIASAPALAQSGPRSGPGPCRQGALALAMLDIIEAGKMNTPGFVRARGRFAQACAPR